MNINGQKNANIGNVENADIINKNISITQRRTNAVEFAEAVNNVVGIIRSVEDYAIKISNWAYEKKNRSQAKSYLKQAREYDCQGNFEAAINCLLKSIKLDYSSARAHNSLATSLLLETDRYDEALVHAKIALEIEPEEPVFYQTLAELYFSKGDLDTAAKNSIAAYKFPKSNVGNIENIKYNACHCLGRICLKKELWSDAVKNFTQCLEINKPNPFLKLGSVYCGLAFALNELGNSEEALIYIKKANEVDPCKLYADMIQEKEEGNN